MDKSDLYSLASLALAAAALVLALAQHYQLEEMLKSAKELVERLSY